MKALTITIGLLALVAGCQTDQTTAKSPQVDYEDLSQAKAVVASEVYQLGTSGICGTVEPGVIKVTQIVPGSPADGKVRVGDRVTGLQYRGLGDVRATVAKRIYRLGRDWNWKLYVTVERPTALNGAGNTLLFPLSLPPSPGILQHMGPTGLYAKIYPDHLRVEKVAEGSPADGKLEVGDRIIAVDGEPISADVFEQWTRAIDKAETPDAGGMLPLTVRRTAPLTTLAANDAPRAAVGPVKDINVALSLAVLGSYRDTAPVNCPKTDAIVTRAAEAIIANKDYDKLNIALLGLLATGEQKYIDHVGEVIHKSDFASPDIAPDMYAPMVSWRYSYTLILLSEYYLMTGDKYVLRAIEKYAVAIAEGQDVAGLWNHRGANPEANFGTSHARLYGYGAINQTSISLWIGLILAEKCGVDHPQVRTAVATTHRHFANWIDRGALPYGNHGYVEQFLTNNGTSGSAAVAFALLGDRQGARHFASMSAAAWDEIYTGHTGPFFNYLWTGLGTNVLGPDVAAAFDRKVHWLRTIVRRYDSRFHYYIAGGNTFEYGSCSSTGANLLNLCVGRRAICITGKQADRSLWLTGAAAKQAVDAGQIIDISRRGLLKALGHNLPRVRVRSAELLAIADRDVTRDVGRMLNGGDRNQRIGAMHAITSLKIDSTNEELMAIAENQDEDLWLRTLAVRTLGELDGAKRFTPRLMALVMKDKPYDARQDLDAALGATLNRLLGADPLADDLDKVLLYKVANKLLAHPRMVGRGAGMQLIRNIPLTDLVQVADSMVYVIKDRDRTYTSYHGDGHRQAGLEILNRLNIEEVIPLTVTTINEKTGRIGPRLRGRMSLLQTFGGEAKSYIPLIRENLGGKAGKIVEQIEAAKTTRQMIPLQEAKKLGSSEQ